MTWNGLKSTCSRWLTPSTECWRGACLKPTILNQQSSVVRFDHPTPLVPPWRTSRRSLRPTSLIRCRLIERVAQWEERMSVLCSGWMGWSSCLHVATRWVQNASCWSHCPHHWWYWQGLLYHLLEQFEGTWLAARQQPPCQPDLGSNGLLPCYLWFWILQDNFSRISSSLHPATRARPKMQ